MQLDIEQDYTGDLQLVIEEFTITPLQELILNLLSRGLSNKEIADIVEITEHSIKQHVWMLGKYFNIDNSKHIRIKLVYYWSCELFRKGLRVRRDKIFKFYGNQYKVARCN
jgi:DNA-binding CsgD family transcriptional regulator